MPVLVVALLALAVSDGTARLAAALETGTPDDVAWVAREVGTEVVAAALGGGDPIGVRAAAAAAPAVDDGWSLLADLADVAGGWERAPAVAASRAAVVIARGLDADAAIVADLADDMLAADQARWSELAGRADRWPDVRVVALEIAARLAAARRATADDDPGLGYDLAAFLADPDPALRRAAAELVPQPTAAGLRAPLARAVIDDRAADVALAAAQALCADLGAGDPAAPILAALGPPGLDRLRAVVAAPDVGERPPGALVDAARCLVADASPASRGALRALVAHAPRAARAQLAALARP